MYQALYRKWRPKTFEDVVGQERVTETLKKQVAEGCTSHAYLFTGTRGTGKTTCAKILAKAVNCEHPVNGNPCNSCKNCVGIESGGFLDVVELDAASNNGVEQIRALRDEAIYAPANVFKRVYIIDEVHMLSTAAFNALLKIMEEPPEHLMFILATTELHKVPATVLSRCQRFSFRRIMPEDIRARLSFVAQQEKIQLTDDGAELLSRMADGALRDALSLLDQCAAGGGVIDAPTVLSSLGLAGNLQTAQLMELILNRDAQGALCLLGELYTAGRDVSAMISGLSSLGRDLLIRMTAPRGGAALLTGGYDNATLERLSQNLTPQRLIAVVNTLQTAAAALNNSANPRTDAELCVLRLCDESLCGDLTAVVSRLRRVEDALAHRPVSDDTISSAPPKSKPIPRAPEQSVPEQSAPIPSDPKQDAVPVDLPWDEPPLPSDADAPPAEEGRDSMAAQAPENERAPTKMTTPPTKTTTPPQQSAAKAPAVPRDNTPPPAPARGSDDSWPHLVELFKSKLPMARRAFLNLAGGRMDGDTLLIECDNDLAASALSQDDTVAVFRQVLAAEVGPNVGVRVTVNDTLRPHAAAATTERAPKSAPKAPPMGGDPLASMLEVMKGNDNMKIE